MADQKCIGLENLEYGISCADQDNMGGIMPTVIAFYHEDVDSWPDKPAPTADEPMTFDRAGEWDGDVVMKPGCQAVKIDFTDDTGLLNITDQGEKGAISFLYELNMVFARMRSKAFGFENATKNRKMGVIGPDSTGSKYLLGDKDRGAVREAGDGSTSGTAISDRNQSSVKFTYPCTRKLVYTGDTEALLKPTPEAGG